MQHWNSHVAKSDESAKMSSTSWDGFNDACLLLSDEKKSAVVTLWGVTELMLPGVTVWDVTELRSLSTTAAEVTSECKKSATSGCWLTVPKPPLKLWLLIMEECVNVTVVARSEPCVTGTWADATLSARSESCITGTCTDSQKSSPPFSELWLGACEDMTLSANDWNAASAVSFTCLWRDGGRRFDWIRARSYNINLTSCHTSTTLHSEHNRHRQLRTVGIE